ncbi:MAG: RNase [Chloroflexi bacterium]|nr:RNase [Chloroflexota bacterium]
MTDTKQVAIYTDGACIGNPGPGGYGVVLLFNGRRKELSNGFRRTTNNRMELLAVIEGLRSLKEPCDVTLFSDSQYVVNGMTKGWAKKWEKSNWTLASGARALNQDLWEQLLRLCEHHHVKFNWVRGHAGNRENERADKLALAAAHGKPSGVDVGYEQVNR